MRREEVDIFHYTKGKEMDWGRATMRLGPRILSDHVSRDATPNLERENMTWIRVVGRSASEVAALNDYTFPFAVGGVNQHIVICCQEHGDHI